MYTPLKITTDFTLLNSLIKIDDLINFCLLKKIKCCGICDSNLFCSIEFYKKDKQNNIKPIIGLEIEINNYKIYLYAKNYDGYKNLLKLNTVKNEKEITIDLLKNYKNNILVILPVKSIDLVNDLDYFIDLYLGYENKEELKNVLIKTNNVVYINDIKVLNKEDIKYLKYLDKINNIDNN